jgi:hypothetical protein
VSTAPGWAAINLRASFNSRQTFISEPIDRTRGLRRDGGAGLSRFRLIAGQGDGADRASKEAGVAITPYWLRHRECGRFAQSAGPIALCSHAVSPAGRANASDRTEVDVAPLQAEELALSQTA